MEDGITIKEPNGVEEVAIDIDESVVAMRRRLHENRDGIRGTISEFSDGQQVTVLLMVNKLCIYRVPQSLIGIHPTAIQPELVSIGPHHRGKNELMEFESYKWWFLNRLLSRTKRHGGPDNLRDLYEAAKKLEGETRRCYDEYIPMSSSDFVEMMVLDGCFIIELFRHVCRNEDVIGTNDPILSMPWLIPILTRDLLKLENQLPIFVLQTLFDLTASHISVGDPLALLALKFFNLSVPRPNEEVLKTKSNGMNCHLLALFHSSFRYNHMHDNNEELISCRVPVPGLLAFPKLPPLPEQSVGRVRLLRYWSISVPIFCLRWSVSTIIFCLGWIIAILRLLYNVLCYCLWWSVSIPQRLFSLIPDNSQEYHPVLSIQSTTQLRPSGIKFKPIKADSFLQIKFNNRVLQIPPITINDLTIAVFINCMAYEQCHGQCVNKYFTDYIAFLSCLISSPRDVAYLCADGIITSYSHNDHYIAGLFNKLGEKLYVNKSGCYLSKQFKDVEAYYGSHWGTFMRTYFSTSWTFISVFSAFVLLVFTGGQTVMAILSYINKRS